MINPVVQPFPQPGSGATQSRTNNQSGLADFGALLETESTGEGDPSFSAEARPMPIPGDPISNQTAGVYLSFAGPRAAPLPSLFASPTDGQSGNAQGNDEPSQASATAAPMRQQPAVSDLPRAGSALETALRNGPSAAERIDTGAIGNHVELVSEPWGLHANAGLSYLTIETDAQASAASLQQETSVPPPTGPSQSGQLFTFAAFDEAAPEADWLHSLQFVEAAPEHDLSSAASTPTAEAARSAPAATAASQAWP
ncbi:MAG TPA: hypothetical protein VK660_10660, partial [Xanthomonadaceae bacterium]|nr:hypothetical protein [Xanthomonadaceae bacterium]